MSTNVLPIAEPPALPPAPPTTTTTTTHTPGYLNPSYAPTLSSHPRLNLYFPDRLGLFSLLSFTGGFMLGSALGGPEAALRYRAENAHRLPTSTPGWYLYHKSKNYHAIVGGTKRGVVTGFKCTAWGALFMVVEEGFDLWKGQKDFTSSAGAGLTMAGVFSAIYHRGDVFTSPRTAKIALLGGTAFGVMQDLLGWLRGDVPPYVQWLRRKGGKNDGKEDRVISLGQAMLEKEGDKI